MVCTDRDPGDLRSVFPGARSAPRAGAIDDARSGRRNAGVVHETDAARGRSRLHVRLPAYPKKTMATTFRANVERGNAKFLSATPVQPQLRNASGRLVRAGASGRRFRRDVRDLADAGFRLAKTLRRLESAAKARVRRRADEIARRQTADAHAEVSRGRLQFSQRKAEDLLRAETETLRRTVSRLLRCRSSTVVFGANRDQSEQLSPAEAATIDELGCAIYEREKVPSEQTARPLDRSERRARLAGAERRSAAGFSRGFLPDNPGDELFVHRQIQTHQIASVKKKLKVLVLFDGVQPTPIDADLSEEMKTEDWQTEANVMSALKELGHIPEHLAIFDDVDLVRQKMESFQPDVLFNLVEQFKNNPGFDQNIVSLLEMQGVPFTGCGSTGMTLCKHKGISKKILGHHGILTPNFVVIPRGQRIGGPRKLKFPILVKPVKEEASYGISRASFVETDESFRERVGFVHEKYSSDAIAEEYIEGRELYVSIMGNTRLTVFPMRELMFREVPPNEPRIATYKAKWDEKYRKRWGLEGQFAENLDAALVKEIEKICKDIYRLLTIDGYARIDLRLTADKKPYFIEANPNPHLAADEDFAQSALKAWLRYPQLIQAIVRLGMRMARG